MSFEQYDIYFSGELIANSDEQTVRQKLAALFKLAPEQIDHLFSGKRVAVKRNVDMDTAVKYRLTFRDAGALVEIKPVATPASSSGTSIPDIPSEPEPATEETTEEKSGMTLSPANTGSLEDYAPAVIPAPIPDISQMSMAEAGSTLDDSEPPPPLEIDTSNLSVAPIGSDISDDE
jgi:hypothetical protein